MTKLFLSICAIMMYFTTAHASIVKYKPITDGAVISFILLNHARISNEIEHGDGDYVTSLGTQANIDIALMRKLLHTYKDPYKFAKAVIKQR